MYVHSCIHAMVGLVVSVYAVNDSVASEDEREKMVCRLGRRRTWDVGLEAWEPKKQT